MAKRGPKAKGIDVPAFPCPSCGKTISGMRLKRVVDEPATPAETHYEIEGTLRAGTGGLLDGQKED